MTNFKHYDTIEEILRDDPKTASSLLSATSTMLAALNSDHLTEEERDTLATYYETYLDRLRQIALERALWERKYLLPKIKPRLILSRLTALIVLAWFAFMVRRFTELQETLIDSAVTACKAALLGSLLFGLWWLVRRLWKVEPQRLD